MNKIKIHILIILMLISWGVFSQNAEHLITGTVIDKLTRHPLEGANIILVNTKSPQLGSKTDANGQFQIRNVPAGKYTVQVSYLGYTTIILKEQVLSEKEKLSLNIMLEKSSIKLDEVVINRGPVYFKKASLYEGEEKEQKNINGFYALDIFKDGAGDEVWGLGKTDLYDFKLSNTIVHSGKASLDLAWDKSISYQTWVGFGIGWEQWSGKDVALVENKAAIQFYIRTATGKMKNLVMVFILEDYSGKACVTVFKDFNYLENKVLDENWNKVTIPFSEFKIDREKCDMSNIKQLIIQVEVKGHIYLDDMEIVEYKK